MLGRIRKANESAKIDAAIIGRVRMGRAGKEVYLLWVDATPGDLQVDEVVVLRGKDADKNAALQKVLGGPLDQIAGSSAPTAEPKKEEPKKEEPKKEEPLAKEPTGAEPDKKKEEPEPAAAPRKKNDYGSALFVIGLDFGIGGRFFDYSDPIENDSLSGNVRPYDVFGPPMGSLYAELYPLVGTGVPLIKNLGVQVGYARAFGITSSTQDGDPIDTTWDRFNVGLRFRVRTGEPPAPILGFSGGFGFMNFNFGDPPESQLNLDTQVADVSYKFIHLGLDIRVPIGSFAVFAGGDYLAPLSSGEVYDRFKGAGAGGVDLNGGFGLMVTTGLEVRLRADYTRFFYAFEPEVGDAYIAGGALDHFLFFSLGVAYVY
jgi:hypothetical protein